MVNDTAAKFVDPKTLVPWENNPRNNDIAVSNIKKSIELFGFTSPIIVRKQTNQVIAGHTRLKAALSLDLKVVPVRFLEITDSQARQLAIADNKLGEIATWDDDGLSKQLELILSEMEDYDFSDIGFTQDEIDALVRTDFEAIPDASLEEEDSNDLTLTKISFTVPSEFADDSVSAVKRFLEEAIPDHSIHVSATERKILH
jgi:ParB-like chromosome segregation protein Spo0J